MNMRDWKRHNDRARVIQRLKHPWPLYHRVGGITAVVTRADGTKEDYGTIADSYAKRWKVGRK